VPAIRRMIVGLSDCAGDGGDHGRSATVRSPAKAIDIWDRFGEHVRRLADEPRPADGSRTVTGDVTDDTGRSLGEGGFLIRVTVDGRSESQIVQMTR
jgi:hypothetical protein